MIDIVDRRLTHQLLYGDQKQSPVAVVRHMLCMQAQDRNQHLWAIACRAGCQQKDIIQAYNDGHIVRTRTQRGTLHTIVAEDVGWMIKLCASKTLTSFAKRRNYLGISDTIAEKALHLMETFLGTGAQTRQHITQYLQDHGIAMQAQRTYHLLCYAATLGLIVQGPMIDHEQAFVLTSQWIKNPQILTESESITTLCLRYFASHGPATVEDLQRWSGLGKTILRKGIHDGIESHTLQSYEQQGKVYYHLGSGVDTSNHHTHQKSQIIHFLAGFDERLLGYKDRSATVDTHDLNKIDVSRNGVFKPTVMIDGQTIGTWSVKHTSNIAQIQINLWQHITSSTQTFIQDSLRPYTDYLAKELVISFNVMV